MAPSGFRPESPCTEEPARLSCFLHAGKVKDVELAIRATHDSRLLDIKHRVPFEEAARRIASGSVLTFDPMSAADQKSFEEYIKYFKTKTHGRHGEKSLNWLENVG